MPESSSLAEIPDPIGASSMPGGPGMSKEIEVESDAT